LGQELVRDGGEVAAAVGGGGRGKRIRGKGHFQVQFDSHLGVGLGDERDRLLDENKYIAAAGETG
jgi:hypothetical protein